MKNKSGIKITIASLVIAIAVLAAFSMPVSATTNGCALETKYNGTINGGIYFETSALKPNGWMQNPLSATFNNVPDNSTITVARLYTGVWGGSPGKGGNYTITVNGNSSTKYQYCDPCTSATDCDPYQTQRCNAINDPTSKCHHYVTGCNVNFISYDVNDTIQTGNNSVTVTTEGNSSCARGSWDGRVYFVALLVVYNDTSMPQMTYWIDEGAPYMNYGSACSGDADRIYNWFNGTVSGATSMKYWTLGFPHVANSPTMWLNNLTQPIGQPDYKEIPAGYEVFFRWDNLNVSWLKSEPETDNLFYYYESDASYERIYSAVLMVQQQLAENPDLIVTEIEFPTVMRPGKTHAINATIRNEGNTSGAFNVSLYVDTVKNGTINVTSLNASESKTVSFTNVNESEGCRKFRVMADSDGDITESDESNNNRTENYQVGHVIVVKSNDDFKALLNDTGLPTGSVTKGADGTYYIQNLTIENCRGGSFVVDAGRGIWIENTNVPFVINNCTVKNCKEHGIDLGHLTNGKIEECEAKDNQLKGIRVVNSSYVDIVHNLVQNNSEYGIDVYPEDMPEVDCEYINITNNNTVKENLYGIELIGSNCTVRDNNVTNNSVYGIYVFGNDSKIYNNTIKYNDNYGIYLDNTTAHPCCENVIYENKFVDNKVGSPGHQGYDTGTNYWNTTEAGKSYTGNYWKDWQNNNGFPCNYTIDGGDAVDKRPKGLYDFLTGESKDKWAFRYRITQDEFNSPIYPSTEFTTDQYGNIEADDDTFQIDDTGKNQDGYYAAHRFNFSIAEPESKITKINVTWNGKGYHDLTDYNGARLYIWNFSSAEYEQLADTTSGEEANLTGQITTNIGNYVNAGNVTVLAKQERVCSFPPSKKSYIETDYVRVAVVATP